MAYEESGVNEFESRLKHNIVHVPKEIEEASGIVINGRRIRSLLFSTDVALIHNSDADAVFAVHPFTAHRAISSAIINMAARPVFCGVGGGVTHGERSMYLASDAESQGAVGIVVNVPFPNADLLRISEIVDIPVVATVVNADKNHVGGRIRNGASIINVAGGKDTAALVAKIRADFPQIPIIASGGKTPELTKETIDAGANAIIYSPPTTGELFNELMAGYREKYT